MAKRTIDNSVVYFSLGVIPIKLGVTRSEVAFKREMAKLNCGGEDKWLSDNALATTHWLHSNDNRFWALVCLRRDLKNADSIAAHEAVHVWQYFEEACGEQRAGNETEAYAIQHIFDCITNAIKDAKK